MSGAGGDRLYNLLPAVYRVRDVSQGQPLRALLALIEDELALIESDIDNLYDNWFIETCAEWVVPYLGDLVGTRGLLPLTDGAFSQRAFVANTLAYKRRKGTASGLEHVAHDITGWPAHAVEFFELLAATQFINHLRPGQGGTIDLRDTNRLELVGGPLESAAHTVDVRHIDNGRGRYDIPHVSIFLWRLASYFISDGTARRAASSPPDGRYTFDPLGASVPLFNRPRSEVDISQPSAEANVPDRLRRRPLYDELEALRQALVDRTTPRSLYFGEQPVLQVSIRKADEHEFVPIPDELILICDLSDTSGGDWRRPPHDQDYLRSAETSLENPPTVAKPIDVAVDPVLGRLAFRGDYTDFTRASVDVSYAYGFSGDLGGGPYDRRKSVASWLDPSLHPPSWQIGVTQDQTALSEAPAGQLVNTLKAAINGWHDYLTNHPEVRKPFGLISIMDNRSYAEPQPLPRIEVPANATLAIISADWPLLDDPDSPGQRRFAGVVAAEDRRAHVRNDLTVAGTAEVDSVEPGELILDGHLIEGGLTVVDGNLGRLRIGHTTLVPGKGGLSVAAGNPRLTVELDRVISGSISLADSVPKLSILDSIVDGAGGSALEASGCRAIIDTSTLFGSVALGSLEASNDIFTQPLTVTRRQEGCVRFSFLPVESLAPRRYHCRPVDAAEQAQLFPHFTSVTYGHPGYAQLRLTGQDAITTGADDEGEMGAFHFLQSAKRAGNLRANLDEYLRFGLEAGLLFVT
jgi:hypothetical protein